MSYDLQMLINVLIGKGRLGPFKMGALLLWFVWMALLMRKGFLIIEDFIDCRQMGLLKILSIVVIYL